MGEDLRAALLLSGAMGGPKKVGNGFKYHQYQIVGRHAPTAEEPSPQLYRMNMWSTDAVRARSKFWYFMSMPTKVSTYGVWVRYISRSGEHNMYKEYRDTSLNGAVESMYDEMGSRHRVRFPQIQIIKTAIIPDERVKRANSLQYMEEGLKFPLVQQKMRAPIKSMRTLYKGRRPNLCM